MLLLEFLVRGVLLGATYGLVALPISLLFATTGSVDMAVGSYAVLAAAIAMIVGGPFGIAVGIVASILASAVVAVISLRLNKPGRSDPLTVVLASFGCALFLESLVLSVYGKDPLVQRAFLQSWNWAGIRVSPQGSVNMAVGAATLVGLLLVLYRTPFGQSMRASAINPLGATLSGIPVVGIWFSTYAMGGLLSGIAGVLILYTTGLTYNAGLYVTITAFGAALLFGLGSPLRAFGGGLAFGVVQSVCAGYLPGSWPTAVPFIFIFLVLARGRANQSGIAGGRA